MHEVRRITSSETVLGALTLHILTQTLMCCWMGTVRCLSTKLLRKADLMKLVEWCCWRWRCPSLPHCLPSMGSILSWDLHNSPLCTISWGWIFKPPLIKYRQHPLQTPRSVYWEYQIPASHTLNIWKCLAPSPLSLGTVHSFSSCHPPIQWTFNHFIEIGRAWNKGRTILTPCPIHSFSKLTEPVV